LATFTTSSIHVKNTRPSTGPVTAGRKPIDGKIDAQRTRRPAYKTYFSNAGHFK
jgi:hypothetical protein